MGGCVECGGSGKSACPACDGRCFMAAAAGGVGRCALCRGEGAFRCGSCRGTGQGDGPGPGTIAGGPLRPVEVAALGLLLVLVGWPALLIIDFALGVFLAHVI